MILSNISFAYKNKVVFSNLNLDLSIRNNLYLIKGPNGSGKTTLLKIISGLIRGYKGSLTNSNYSRIRGSLDFFGFDDSKSGHKNIKLFNNLIDHQDTYNELLSRFSMNTNIHLKIKKMSDGMKKKCSLIDAFLIKPDLIILDEPFNSIDLESQNSLIQIINIWRTKYHCTFIITSHFDINFDKNDENVTTINL